MAVKIISNNLELDTNGTIKLLEDYAAKKEMTSLYCSINNDEIPFLTYGLNFEYQILKNMDRDALEYVIEDFIKKLQDDILLTIQSYDYKFVDNELNIEIQLMNGDTLVINRNI